jgi:hypothetical protein
MYSDKKRVKKTEVPEQKPKYSDKKKKVLGRKPKYSDKKLFFLLQLVNQRFDTECSGI